MHLPNADLLEDKHAIAKADLTISCMVSEPLDEAKVARCLQRCCETRSSSGIRALLVPGSERNCGIEDRIAEHHRRYSISSPSNKLMRAGCKMTHISGLTFPISNLPLPLSNFLAKKNELGQLRPGSSARRRASGRRRVPGKNHSPNTRCTCPMSL